LRGLSIIFGLTFLTACSVFNNKEKRAIEICQKAKVHLETGDLFADFLLLTFGGVAGLGESSTWLDLANILAKEEPNKRYDWKAKATKEKDIYLVSFADKSKWGLQWEVDIEQQIVKLINQNGYLSRKYGQSRLDPDGSFEVTNISVNTIKLVNERGYYSKDNSKRIVYTLKASVKNKTGKTLTEGHISGNLKVVFKEKTVDGNSTMDSGFKSNISESRPWANNTEKDFYLQTTGIETVYLDYEPEYVFFEVILHAEDPIGFMYDKNIAEYDLKDKWKNLRD